MNDFFTELDSDLLGTRKPSETPKNTPPPTRQEWPEYEKKTPPTREKPPVENKGGSHASHSSMKPRREKSSHHEQSAKSPTGYIADIRSQMMKAGVVVVIFKADERTKTLLGNLKLETRGFLQLDEVREMHKAIIKKARASYEDTLKDIPDIEEKELIKIIRHDLELFLVQKTQRNPVIIPIIIPV